ncbi:D-aminoacyl-tRNA deacylase 2-like [Tubulanus polymorphus]|uniref:D-aminoacyl-tRNA deacylase 2-like n=1 Tax=Tubulanus polymorphus TaxID=672921 RepID=UPI003DA44CED
MSNGEQKATVPRSRALIQQCLSARLQTQPPTEDSPACFVEIKRGIVVYICFLKEADEDTVKRIAKTVMQMKLSEETTSGKYVSVMDLAGDVLIVPQATLGGKSKGKVMQYHGNVDKSVGAELYALFVKECSHWLQSSGKAKANSNEVKAGTYGNRQVLNIETNGPFSHLIEL